MVTPGAMAAHKGSINAEFSEDSRAPVLLKPLNTKANTLKMTSPF